MPMPQHYGRIRAVIVVDVTGGRSEDAISGALSLFRRYLVSYMPKKRSALG